jgi:hypothetical protein
LQNGKIRTEPVLSAYLQWENLSRLYVLSLRAVHADCNIGLTSVFFLTYSSYYFVTFFAYRQVEGMSEGWENTLECKVYFGLYDYGLCSTPARQGGGSQASQAQGPGKPLRNRIDIMSKNF